MSNMISGLNNLLGGKKWNPQTNAWEDQTNSQGFEIGGWGNQGNDVRPDGSTVPGTSGTSRDVDRYQRMGQEGYLGAPEIRPDESNQSREFESDAIGMLGNRASGGVTPAQTLAAEQNRGAVAGIQSGAASIKGGAMARAAASRGAQAQGARVAAQGQQDVQALRAREMADAQGQYFGAASRQRANDLGIATSQAQLEAQHRGQKDQREGFYEGLGYDTKNAQLGHVLGRTASDNAAANAARATGVAADAAEQARTDRAISAGLGAVNGGLQAYSAATQDTTPKPPPGLIRENPYGTSDVKAKENIHHFGSMADANRSMEPSSYEYKPEFTPPEQQPGDTNVGPMANKMKADPVASTAIVKDPETGLLAIDKTKGLKLVMGGLASLQRQVDNMEGRRA